MHATVVEAERHEHLEGRGAAVRAVAGEQLLVREIAAGEADRMPLVAGVESRRPAGISSASGTGSAS